MNNSDYLTFLQVFREWKVSGIVSADSSYRITKVKFPWNSESTAEVILKDIQTEQ